MKNEIYAGLDGVPYRDQYGSHGVVAGLHAGVGLLLGSGRCAQVPEMLRE